jgi:hypothetical protein
LHGKRNKTLKKLTNGAILIISKVLNHVMSSAAEADIGEVFINAKEGAVLRATLEELGHNQPPTPMETDNTTATGYSNGTIKQKRTKAMNMRFYSIKDRVKQGQFNVYWGPGFQNWADYFTKHHSPAHHKIMQDIPHCEGVLIPQVRLAHKYPISPWEMIHLHSGDNALCVPPYTVYTAVCNKSLTFTYQYKISNPSNKELVINN